MEHVEYELTVPETGVQPDRLTFTRSIRKVHRVRYVPTILPYWSHLRETFEPHTIKYRELCCINCGRCPTIVLRWRYTRFDHGPQTGRETQGQPRKCVAMPNSVRVRYALAMKFCLPVEER